VGIAMSDSGFFGGGTQWNAVPLDKQWNCTIYEQTEYKWKRKESVSFVTGLTGDRWFDCIDIFMKENLGYSLARIISITNIFFSTVTE
jgi:hypothetical protein